jgi:hypothetical protein
LGGRSELKTLVIAPVLVFEEENCTVCVPKAELEIKTRKPPNKEIEAGMAVVFIAPKYD